MDIPYDHIQEESFSPISEDRSTTDTTTGEQQAPNLNTELRTAFQSISSSQWGTTIGGWFNTARKQGETFYQDLQKEASEAQEQATKGFTSLKEQVANRTRGLSLNAEPGPDSFIPGEEPLPSHIRTLSSGSTGAAAAEAQALQQKPENLPADIVKEAGTLVASLRSTAASRLKDLQKAEDAADEALLKFGTNVRNFLRDAVTITAPDDALEGAEREVLFETQEPGTGKKVFHSTRIGAQLHAIHTTPTSFTQDPAQNEEWDRWTNDFDIDGKTDDIAKHLQKHENLRRAMEQLVPQKVDYKTFWMRYYFLRKAVEEEERRRREILKGAVTDHEEIAWDEDSDEDEEPSSTPNAPITNQAASESTTTLHPSAAATSTARPASPRRSHEDEIKSVAGSDASYDIVSGATSRAMGSPKEEKKDPEKDDSDDDWE